MADYLNMQHLEIEDSSGNVDYYQVKAPNSSIILSTVWAALSQIIAGYATAPLLTEDGLPLLTEDGGLLLAERKIS